MRGDGRRGGSGSNNNNNSSGGSNYSSNHNKRRSRIHDLPMPPMGKDEDEMSPPPDNDPVRTIFCSSSYSFEA